MSSWKPGLFDDVARHEAGHQVACVALHVPITRIVISSPERGTTSYGRISGTRLGKNDRLVRKRGAVFARIVVAGPLAERIPYGDTDRQVLDELQRAEHDASRPFWTDAGPFRASVDSCLLSEQRAAHDARRLLGRHWRAVLRIARVLETKCDDAVRRQGVPPLHSTTPIITLDAAEATALVLGAVVSGR